jgi:Fe-S-cluster containining protein
MQFNKSSSLPSNSTMSHETIELDFPEGIINYPIKKSGGPRLFWNIVYDLLPLCNILTEKGVQIAASFNQKVSCQAGCGVCCRQMVPLSPPEAAIIADVVDRLPKKRKKKVVRNFSDAVEKISEAGLLETLLDMYRTKTDKQEVLENNKKYFNLSIYCPFLVDGSCSIYPHRPSRCREFSVLSPAEYCVDPFDIRIKRLPLTIKLCESFSLVWSTLTGKPPIIIPLVYALEWVRNNPEIKTLCIPKSEVSVTIRSILENACSRANKIAQKRMAGH